MHRKKKKITEMNYKKLAPINIREKNLMSRQQQHNCFNKNEIRIILKSFLTLTARKNFAFIPWFRKQKPSLVSRFWIGGENCIVKNEKCTAFPES